MEVMKGMLSIVKCLICLNRLLHLEIESDYEMKIDKPNCESSAVHDRKEKDDVEKRIQAKYKLL